MPSTRTRAEPAPVPPGTRRRAALVATAVALPVTALLVFLVNPGAGRDPAPAPTRAAPTAGALPPVRVAPPPELDTAGQRSCQELISALPTQLGDRPARPVDSSSPYVVAWGEPAIVLRCGVARPPSFVATADVNEINTVVWFAERRGSTTAWTVVDRPVYVEVLVPADESSEPVARLSTAVTRSLKPQPLDPVR